MISLSNLKDKDHYKHFLGLRRKDCKVKMDRNKNKTNLLEI